MVLPTLMWTVIQSALTKMVIPNLMIQLLRFSSEIKTVTKSQFNLETDIMLLHHLNLYPMRMAICPDSTQQKWTCTAWELLYTSCLLDTPTTTLKKLKKNYSKKYLTTSKMSTQMLWTWLRACFIQILNTVLLFNKF